MHRRRLHYISPLCRVGLHKFWQNFNALFNLQNSSAEFRSVCCRERTTKRASAEHTAYVDGDSAASSAAATSCAERTAGSGSRVVKRVNQQQCTQHLVHSHDTCALHTHALALSLYCVLSRPNETERRLARRSLALPACIHKNLLGAI